MLFHPARQVVLVLGILAAASASAQTFEQVFSIPKSGTPVAKTIGQRPKSNLTLGPDGKLYGTTSEGGAFGAGTAFRVTTTGEAEWLGDFNPSTTGDTPVTSLVNVGDGKLYGVTHLQGGTAFGKYGTLFQIDPTSISSTSEGALTPFFQVPGNSGVYNARALCSGEPGIFHLLCDNPAGIYRVPQNGATPTVLYKFGNKLTDGDFAWSIISGGDGFLYGTTVGEYRRGDGKDVYGTIFRIRTDGTGMTRLHEFLSEDGETPYGALVAGPNGYLYGLANDGGKAPGNGTIYRIDRYGQDFSVVKDLDNSTRYPYNDLLLAPDGYFYGTAESGTYGYGAIFRIKPDGSGFKILYSFLGKADSGYPTAGLTLGPDGNLYGVTRQETETSGGSVFRIRTKFAAPTENRPPTALDDLVTGVSIQNGPVDIAVRKNDFDPDGDLLALAIVDQPTHGTLEGLPGGVLRYTPGNDFVGQDSFTYQISDGRGGLASATVSLLSSSEIPLVQAGLYTGLVRQVAETSDPLNELPHAQVSVQLTAAGKITGTLMTQGKRHPLKSNLNAAGSAVIPLTLPDKTKAQLYVGVLAGQTPALKTVLYAETLSTGLAAQATPLESTTKLAATVFTSTVDPLPVGYGSATMTITAKGVVTLTGKLGDGTKFSAASNLTKTPDGRTLIPLFDEPIKDGVWAGDLTTTPAAESLFAGDVRWVRPKATKQGVPYQNGFNTTVETTVWPYTAPAAKQPVLNVAQAVVKLAGSVLTESAKGNLTISGASVKVSSPLKAFTFSRTTGAFSGKILVGKKSVSFSGSVLQGENAGYGLFILDGVAGTVNLAPPQVD